MWINYVYFLCEKPQNNLALHNRKLYASHTSTYPHTPSVTVLCAYNIQSIMAGLPADTPKYVCLYCFKSPPLYIWYGFVWWLSLFFFVLLRMILYMSKSHTHSHIFWRLILMLLCIYVLKVRLGGSTAAVLMRAEHASYIYRYITIIENDRFNRIGFLS